MQRVTVTLDDDLLAAIDRLAATRGYQNRSEAIRDLARSGLEQHDDAAGRAEDCVAAVIYVYDHQARELPKRLTHAFHDHHEMSLATFHVHLDPANCLEVTMLRGAGHEVRHFAEHVIAERGVRHGHIVLVPLPAGTRRRRTAKPARGGTRH
jgi:CopG family nickel-responsive transcriptional regulator